MSQTQNNNAAGVVSPCRQLEPRSSRGVGHVVLFALLLVLFGGLAYRSANYINILLRYPYEWDEDEGYAILFAQRLVTHQPVYTDFNKLPMVTPCYPPLYHAVVSLLVRHLGPTLLAGRAVSVIAVAGLCAVIALAVWQETKQWSLAVLATALFVGSPYVTIWGPLSRVDSLAVLLAMAGALVVRQYPRSRAAIPLGLLLLLAACYTKSQMALLTPAVFWYLWRHSRCGALIGLAGFTVAVLAVLAWLMYWSDGHFWSSTVTSHANEYTFTHLINGTSDFLVQHTMLVAGALGWLFYRISRRDLDLWGAVALGSGLVILTVGSLGASINYFIPSIAAAAICTTLAFAHLRQNLPTKWSSDITCLAMLALILQGVGFAVVLVPTPGDADRQAGDRIVSLIRGTTGQVLTERRIMFSLLAGREPQIDACTMGYTYPTGREQTPEGAGNTAWRPKAGGKVLWDTTELVTAIREKQFPLIILVPEFFPREITDTISVNYRLYQSERVSIGTWHGQNQYLLLCPL